MTLDRRSKTDSNLNVSVEQPPQATQPLQPTTRFYQLLADLGQAHEAEIEALRGRPSFNSARGSFNSAPPMTRRKEKGSDKMHPTGTDPDSDSICNNAVKGIALHGKDRDTLTSEEVGPMLPPPRDLNPSPPPLPPVGHTSEADLSSAAREALRLQTLATEDAAVPSFHHVPGPVTTDESSELQLGIGGPGVVPDDPIEERKEKKQEPAAKLAILDDTLSGDESFILGPMHTTTPTCKKHVPEPAGEVWRGEENYGLSRGSTRNLTPCRDYNLLPIWRSELTRGVERKISFSRRSSGILHPSQLQTRENQVERSAHPLQRIVLHPSSLKRLTWDLMSMSLLAYDIMVIPFVGAFEPAQTGFLLGMTWGTLLFWTCDMPLSMLSGYQQGKNTILNPQSTMLHYVKSWFLLDLLIIGMDWVALLLEDNDAEGGNDSGGSVTRLGRTLRTLRFIRTLRLIRVLKLKRIVQAIQDSINTEAISIVFGIFKIIMCLIVANHIVACGWYAMAYQFEENGLSWVFQAGMERRSLTYRYMTSLHWSLTQFTPASMEVVPQTTGERIYTVVVILFAMIAFSSFVSILTASMAQLQRMSSNESRQFWLLRRYLRDWNVRRQVGLRVQRYLEYAYQKQKNKVQEHEVKLLALLSEPLRLELKHETFSHYLSGHPLFLLCSEQARVFGKALAATSLAQGDVIFACGELARRVTFLTGGMLEYTLGLKMGGNGAQAQGGERDYLFEGMWCSEAVLWTEWHHLGDLQAMTECQVITVDAKQFCEAVQLNAPMWLAVRKYAEKFIDALNTVDLEDLTDLTHQLFSPHEAIDPDDFHTGGDREGTDLTTETRFARFVKFGRWLGFGRPREAEQGNQQQRSSFSPPNSPQSTISNSSLPWGKSKVVPTSS